MRVYCPRTKRTLIVPNSYQTVASSILKNPDVLHRLKISDANSIMVETTYGERVYPKDELRKLSRNNVSSLFLQDIDEWEDDDFRPESIDIDEDVYELLGLERNESSMNDETTLVQLIPNPALYPYSYEYYYYPNPVSISFKQHTFNQNLCIRTPSPQMMTLQHMKIFTNDNQLFTDTTKNTDSHEYLYRILDTGHIQMVVYDKKFKTWDTSIVGNLEFETIQESSFHANLQFTDKNLVVACDGISRVSVFLVASETNWINMLKHKVTKEDSGLALIEARVLDDKLQILAYEVESCDDKKTRSRIYWITVILEDIDYTEALTIEKTTEFVQNGHFETATFTNDGYILFLSSERPHADGDQNIPEVVVIDQDWSQNENTVEVKFKLSAAFSQEDVNINVTSSGIKLLIKETSLLNGKLGGDIDENNVEICADQKTNTLIVKLKSTENKKWDKLIVLESSKMESAENYWSQNVKTEALAFFWISLHSKKVIKWCPLEEKQVVSVIRDYRSTAQFMIANGDHVFLWNLEDGKPVHVSTLEDGFEYLKYKKKRIWGFNPEICTFYWSSCSQFSAYAQKRKIEKTHPSKNKEIEIAKSYSCSENITGVRGVYCTKEHIYLYTINGLHVAGNSVFKPISAMVSMRIPSFGILPSPTPRYYGACKWFNASKGYGFVIDDVTKEDLFVHQSHLNMQGFRSLEEGERVSYKIKERANGGKEAYEVSGEVEGQGLKGSRIHPLGRKKRMSHMEETRLRCFRCGKFATHKAKSCPNVKTNAKVCYTCGFEEHLFSICPERNNLYFISS